MIDDLGSLGWKAFQDLCTAVASEVLGRPVQTFLPSKDGGRDGAFVGTWEGAADDPTTKSTIQCKFTGKVNATLTLSQLQQEQGKVAKLAAQGLAHDYVIMTNAGVSGEADAAICAAFEAAGAQRCRVLGGDWIINRIRESPRLRTMVPRVYGIGDLSQILQNQAYLQARYILSAMGDDLRCFVTTEAHRKSVSALSKHGFVLLLGDPASGKSTIAATLALGALDAGSVGALRITSPEQLSNWNPHEKQFLWVDDAFGPNQFDASKTNAWNDQLPLLRSALKQGARVVFTSRNYIWEAARRSLKASHFPLFTESQVVIDVQGLAETEKAQILYNHIKAGDQPVKYRRRMKPLLATVAASPAFLPETARRLASQFFTHSLELTLEGMETFVENPIEFLKEVLEKLDRAAQAAIALIFLQGPMGVPSPISMGPDLEMVARLMGVREADISRALEFMNGSLVLLVERAEGRQWTFRHPTIADAFASLVAESPELIELYMRGAKLDRALDEVVCGAINIEGAKVRVPISLYQLLLSRLDEQPLDIRTLRFLTSRCDVNFLHQFMEINHHKLEQVVASGARFADRADVSLLARLAASGLLPENVRAAAVKSIDAHTMSWIDSTVFHDAALRSLFTQSEFLSLADRFQTEFLKDVPATVERWGEDFYSSDMASHFRDLRESLERAAPFFTQRLPADFAQALIDGYKLIDERIEEFENDEWEPEDETKDASPLASASVEMVASIFDDVDEI